MSTKQTIDHGPNNYWKKPVPEGIDFHLYYECLDEDNVYLELYDCPFSKTEVFNGRVRTTMAIPGKLWNHFS